MNHKSLESRDQLPAESIARPRLLSLDVFRGATVAAMILVNNPGDWDHVFWPLDHSEWNGCTPTDLVMPFFLFIVGVSIVYALDRARRDPVQHRSLILKAARRAGVLLLLGWLLAIFPSSPASLQQLIHHPIQRLESLRIMGVLQRIAVVYFVCALIFIKFNPARFPKNGVMICAFILLGYWAAMMLIPVPDSVSTAGQLPHYVIGSLEKSTNLAAWIDRTLLGKSHLYKGGDFDPEGPFSTLCAISTGLIGMLVGVQLKAAKIDGANTAATTVAWLFTVGTIAAVVGWTWSLCFPLNKQLWTSSFSLTTSGLAMIFLAAAYWAIDVHQFKRGAVLFAAFGVNAITAFVASGLLARILMLFPLPLGHATYGLKEYAYHRWLASMFKNPELSSFVAAVIYLLLWAMVMGYMQKRRWILKV